MRRAAQMVQVLKDGWVSTSCGTKRTRELDDLEFSGATYD
jgi:hypothetical protein